MKKILWLSQHKWLPRQEAELHRLFEEVALDRDILPFENAEEIIQLYRFDRFRRVKRVTIEFEELE